MACIWHPWASKRFWEQTYWCAGESPASTDLDLWMPMACQVVSALVHNRERERERELQTLVLEGNHLGTVILGSFQFQEIGIPWFRNPSVSFYFSNRSRHANSWDSKKTQLQVLVSKLSQTRENT
jgi:hypothetical protein